MRRPLRPSLRPSLRPVLAAALLVALAARSSVTPEASITPPVTFGQPAANEGHAHVVTLVFRQNGAGYYSCTGTLLSPTVVVTAGHCVEEAGNVNDVTYVRNTQDANEGRDTYADTASWLDAEWVKADAVIPHPDYADYAEVPFTYDVGLVILPDERAFDGLAQCGELAPVGLLDEVKGGKPKNRQFTVVGYGMQGHIPAFSGDTNRIAAIVSFGETPCIGPDHPFRMDTEMAQDFVFGERPELE